MMKKYKCTVAYDGTAYAGFQIQINALTIQEEIEKALFKIHKEQIVKITASGRTDSGVHAKGQVFHFESPLLIPEDNWTKALNTLLNEGIRILATEEVESDFHARFDVLKKEYRYFIHAHKEEDPFRRLYTHHFPYKLSIQKIQDAASLFIGKHDFTAFTSSSSAKEDKVRTIYRLDCLQKENEIILSCEGNGFLHNMVRIIVGTLLEAGQGKRSLVQIEEALKSKERRLAGKTAPAHGLFLWKVMYHERK